MKITHVPTLTEIDLGGALPDEVFEWLESLQGQCHRRSPILRCGRCNSGLYIRHGRNAAWTLKAVHFSCGDCQDIQIARAGMSPEHKREAEYYARAAEQAGYRAELEVPTIARTVVDVVIEGGLVRAGVEVQLAI